MIKASIQNAITNNMTRRQLFLKKIKKYFYRQIYGCFERENVRIMG